jgi:hypothetical protein
MKSMEPVCELCGRPLIFFRLTGENEGFLMARCEVCEPSRFGFQENAINLYGFDRDHAKQDESLQGLVATHPNPDL